MGITIYDIADKADVSIATVSRVFNDEARVSAPTRDRVYSIAQDLGYRPHVSAQSLARRRTQLVSAVVPVMTNFFYMEIMRGMQEALRDTDFDLLVYAAPSPEEVDSQLERAAQRGRADGLFLLSTPLLDGRADQLRESGQPALLVDGEHPDFDSVSVDNAEGGFMATRHLLRAGYERVAHVTVTPEPPPAQERRAGYERALREAGRPVNPDLIVASDHEPFGFVEEAGYEAGRELLALSPRPDAVFVASDVQALGVLRALREDNLRVPDDIAVVGFDGIAASQHVRLTTVRQPMYEMGKLAIEKMLLRIDEPDHPISHTVLSPRLIERATCSQVAKNGSPS